MQTSLNNVKQEEPMDAIMMKMLLPELIKSPESFQNLMQLAELVQSFLKNIYSFKRTNRPLQVELIGYD